MADNWWESSSRNRFESGGATPSSTTSALNAIASFSTTGHKLPNPHSATTTGGGGDGGTVLGTDPDLQMMGLGLSSPGSLDWNQTLFRGVEKGEGGFRTMLQEDRMSSTTSFHQETGMTSSQEQWRSQKMYPGTSEDSSISEFKGFNRGFQLDQPLQYSENSTSTIITCQGLPTCFPNMDSYGNSSAMFQGSLGSDHNQQQQQQSGFETRPMGFSSYQASCGLNNTSSGELSQASHNWSKFPNHQFQENSPPKNSHLHFSNNASASAMNDVRSNFFQPLQMQIPSSTFDDKPKNTSEVVKKSSSESSTKRPRNESPSALQAFKVRKEKMGDRITGLQQLVSPFGKTDTASVLSEAIEYIKFLHEQVNVLSTPYMKNGAAIIQHQQARDNSSEGPKQDLRSRGLCLVPVSSTFPVTHETTVDFWTPTFGGTFR